MKARRLAGILFLICLGNLLFIPSGWAQQPYLAAGAGWVAGQAPDDRTGSPPLDDFRSVDYDGGNGWGAFFAYGIDTGDVRFELEGAYRRHELDVVVSGNAGAERHTTDTDVTSVMINVLYDLPLARVFELSLGGGLGGGFFTIEEFKTPNYTVDYIPGWEAAYQLTADLSYKLNPNLALGLRCHYLGLFDVGTVDASAFSDVLAFLRYTF